MGNAASIIKKYKMKKSATVAGAVVLSTMAVDAIMSKKANKILGLGVKLVVGTATAIATEKLVEHSYTIMNELSYKLKEKAKKAEEEIPEEIMEFEFDDEDELEDFTEEL